MLGAFRRAFYIAYKNGRSKAPLFARASHGKMLILMARAAPRFCEYRQEANFMR